MNNLNNKHLEEYYQYLLIEKNYSKNTIESYFRDINQFIEVNDNIDLIKVDRNQIDNYLMWLRSNFSNNTVLRKISSLNNLYKYLLATEVISKNYFQEVKLSKKKVELPKYLTQEEINLFLNSIEINNHLDYRNKAMFELIYATGMRISELINVKITDLNINESLIRIIGKGDVERIVPINQTAMKYVIDYIEHHRLYLNKENEDYLFLNNSGKKLSRQGFYKILKQLAIKVGIEDISPHKFRHSIATHMLNNGANLKIVQEMLGHKNISTTEIYTHVSKEKLINDYNKYHIFGDDTKE